MSGVIFKAWVEHLLDVDCSLSTLATSVALSSCWRIRGCSVRMPRNVMKLSNGRPGDANDICPVCALFGKFISGRDYRTADDIAVTIDVLGR